MLEKSPVRRLFCPTLPHGRQDSLPCGRHYGKMISQSLAGKKIAITGSTGFLGTALVERFLRTVPECHLVLIVRPTSKGATERVHKEVIRNDCFDKLRNSLGERFDSYVNERVSAIAGDVTSDGLNLTEQGRELLSQCDIIVHSAAAVSFDSPLDQAIEVNLLGPKRVCETLHTLGHPSRTLPHLVAVSTAYVAGYRRGESWERLLSENFFPPEATWQKEVAAAEHVRADINLKSRTVTNLKKFESLARSELGAAGAPLIARKQERIRQDWVDQQLVEIGKVRAHGLGWPDAYAYTKALGEIALSQVKGDLPVSIVRPSIIESAMSEPQPGWIRGFRMAEPVIISYARGLLNEFPGIPEGIIDVIPVDLVTAAIIAVCAKGKPDTKANSSIPIYQVASGSTNPLRYGSLVDIVQEWFSDNPLYDSYGQPISVPKWSFPGRGRVQRQLTRADTILESAEKISKALPFRNLASKLTTTIDAKRTQAQRALSYVELYGAYTETEAVFRVDNLLALYESLAEEDKKVFCFDPRVIDWDQYVRNVHLPSVVEHARARTSPGKRVSQSRRDRSLAQILNPERKIAAFDLENTLIASNVVEAYLWLSTEKLPLSERIRISSSLLAKAPRLLSLDMHDRGDFLRYFYRYYEGASLSDLTNKSQEMFSALLLARSFPEAIRRVRKHRELGHKTILITGALDFIVEPLAPLFDEVVSAQAQVANGILTGHLLRHPPTGEARAQIIDDYARSLGVSLEDCVSYADSSSDLPMLEVVGFPVAVNADPKLALMAERRGWHRETWRPSPGGSKPILALAPGPIDDESFSIQIREMAQRFQRLSKLASARWSARREKVER